MNRFTPPENARKIEVKEGKTIYTPDSFLAHVSVYKGQNPVKYARKEAVFKRKFLELGGAEQDFKIKVVKSREELEVEIAELKAQVASPDKSEDAPDRRSRPPKKESSE